MLRVKLLILSVILLSPSVVFSLPSFPGAEGMGADNIGGRGGIVIHVTNLNDSGAGSFREAVTTSGARTVVFDVSGVINLSTYVNVTEPYLTIAGQTSPGGICIAGQRVRISTHDVIIRHMRFRLGSHNAVDLDMHDAFQIWSGYDVIIDHCSFAWGVDETVEMAYDTHDVTFSRCFFTNPLNDAGHSEGNHGYNFLAWGKDNADEMTFTIHHSYFGTATNRMPEINYYVFGDLRNNVSYNAYGGYAPYAVSAHDSSYDNRDEYASVNWVGNYHKLGPVSNSQGYNVTISTTLDPQPVIYVQGNIGGANVFRASATDPEWCVGNSWHYETVSTDWQRSTPRSTTGIPVTTSIMTTAYATEVVEAAGATVPVRDSVDTSAISDYKSGTGLRTDNVTYPDDWPTYSTSGDNPTDTDSDGMPDAWETANGTDPNVANNNSHTFDSNYTDIEYYINGLADGQLLSVVPPSLHSPVTGE